MERVWSDDQVSDARVVRELGGDRRGMAASSSLLVEQLFDRWQMWRAAFECLRDDALENLGAVAIEEICQTGSESAEISVALSDLVEEPGDARQRMMQAIESACLTRVFFLFGEGADVLRILDAASSIKGAGMSSNDFISVEDAHELG